MVREWNSVFASSFESVDGCKALQLLTFILEWSQSRGFEVISLNFYTPHTSVYFNVNTLNLSVPLLVESCSLVRYLYFSFVAEWFRSCTRPSIRRLGLNYYTYFGHGIVV